MIDFGLARKFTDDGGKVIAARDKREFRGSTSYASIAAHQLEDLGERHFGSPCTREAPMHLAGIMRVLTQTFMSRPARRSMVMALHLSGDDRWYSALAECHWRPQRDTTLERGVLGGP